MKTIFFDGYCNLCNGFVDWLVRRDKKARLKFAPLQGETARRLLPDACPGEPTTIVYLRGDRRFERSSAALMILFDLGGFWKFTAVFWLIPGFLRDWIYRSVAKNRYRLFGKRVTCRIPTPEEKSRFLE